EDILSISPIGVTDNFFELGGTSFQLIKLQRKIDLLWPNKVQVPDLFEYNSIRSIASFISRGTADTQEEEIEEVNFFEI
ncbi:phosphopantetheine-binding protein, partial [Flavobacterium sp. H122]|uniref:phosphopantetheine-binding protein n=1 Tax=Flavobacterium sp. H122 TaxID=2529860 RepID=UPI0010A9B75C